MKLKRLEVNSFGGIHPDSPVVIDFTQSNVVVASGDFGLCKTTLLNALLVACGQLSKDNKAFVNKDSGKIDMNFSFVGKDRCSYEVRCTKSAFTLKYDGTAVSEPISKMKELLGVPGTSPMEMKFKPLKDIIKWLASYSNKNPEGFEGLLVKYKDGIKKAAETRAKCNKAFKALDEYLNGEEMYINWEDSEKKYVERPDLKVLSAEVEVAREKADNLNKAEAKLIQYNLRKGQIEQQIALLNKELNETVDKIGLGDLYIIENGSAKDDYAAVKQKYDNVIQDVMDFNKWESIKEKKTERDEFETAAQRADANEKSLLQELKELQAEILPDIKNVELVVEDTHEDGKEKKEGLYVDGKSVAMLSETEWVSFVFMVWRKFKVKVIVLDNIATLGSKGIELLQKLAKDGAYVLATEMNREQKTLEITYE